MTRRGAAIVVIAASVALGACRSGAEPAGGTAADSVSATTSTGPEPTAIAPTEPTATIATSAAPTTATATVSATAGPLRCAASPPMGVSAITVTGGGAEHAVRVFVPSTFDGTPMPTVIGWHGLGSNGDEQAAYSGYEALAEEQGFMVVHPTGVADGPLGVTSWQLADDPASGRDDVAFADALIDVLVADWCAEPTRVYSTGMSNGGYFTTRLLCELGDRIAAGVSVAGLVHPDGCAPGRPVPLLAFHGTDDRVVPYEGGESVLSGAGVPPALAALFGQSIRVEFEEFVTGNGCSPTATDTFLDSEIVIHTYEGCDGGFMMALFEVRFGGHTWPGSPLRDALDDSLGFTTGRVEATRDGWVYMREFSTP